MDFCGSEGRLFIHFQVEGQRVARHFTPRKRLFLEQDIQIESNLLQILDPSKIQNSSRLVLWSYLKSIATGEWMVCLERRSYNGSDLGKVALIQ